MSKHIVFALLVCLCVSACPRSFHVCRGEGGWRGAGLWQITIGTGSAEIKRFYFCCNWEKGAPSASHMGPLLQIPICIFPLYSSLGPLKYLVGVPDEQSLHCIYIEHGSVFAYLRRPVSPPRDENGSHLSTLARRASGGISSPGSSLATHCLFYP